MLVSILKCSKCGFASETFGDARNMYRDTHSMVFQHAGSNEILVKEVPASLLEDKAINLDAPDSCDLIQQHIAQSQERYVPIPCAQFEVEIDAVCPRCGNSSLTKELAGFQ